MSSRAAIPGAPLDGVLVVDKPSGMTSFDVVRAVRRSLGQRKAGHTGTLDPMATGVLPVCLGPSTRLVPFMLEKDKVYEATVRLGAATDTQDRTGRVIATSPVGELSAERLEAVLGKLTGAIRQVPPMYSAIRVGGQRLHDLARRGVEIERASRPVTVHELTLLATGAEELSLRVRCSAGTYVRTLAHDLGEMLGCHAHLTSLRRTAAGLFTLAEAVPLDRLVRMAPAEVEAWLISPRAALADLDEVVVDQALAARVRQGQRPSARELAGAAPEEGRRFLLSGPSGEILAVAEWRDGALRYLRVLAGESAKS